MKCFFEKQKSYIKKVTVQIASVCIILFGFFIINYYEGKIHNDAGAKVIVADLNNANEIVQKNAVAQVNLNLDNGVAQENSVALQEVKEEEPLKELVVGIDPGHQTKADYALECIAPTSSEKKAKVSSGTQGRFTKVREYELNLDVALLLKEELTALGAKVIMTRENNDVSISNLERAQLANKYNCSIVIRIHANGSDNPEANGYLILVPGSKYTGKIVEESTRFAKILDNTLSHNIGVKSAGIITRDDLTGFNWSEVPVVLLEMGYMTNENDDAIMQTKDFKVSLVKSIGSALIDFINSRDANK